MKNLIAFFILLTSIVSLAQEKTSPTATGAYYHASSGYTRLELATSSGFKTGGMGKAMLSYGVAKIKGKWLYRNPSASLQLADRRPVFTLISQVDVSIQAVALVRLDVKKDHREAQYCEAGAWTGVKEENINLIPLTVTRVPNSNNLTITAQADVPSGEYLLITDAGKGYDGYDFGVK